MYVTKFLKHLESSEVRVFVFYLYQKSKTQTFLDWFIWKSPRSEFSFFTYTKKRKLGLFQTGLLLSF